jgi:hypothetical protein
MGGHNPLRRLVGTCRHVDHVRPGFFHDPGDQRRLLHGQAAGDVLFAGNPVQDDRIGADAPPHFPDDLRAETGPVLQAAPVGIGADIREGRGELANQIAVRAVNLEGVEACFFRLAGIDAILLDDLFNLGNGQGVRHRSAERTGGGGRGDGCPLDEVRVCLPSGVMHLQAHRDPAAVNCIRKSRKPIQDLGPVNPEFKGSADAHGVEDGRPDYDEAHAAFRPPHEIVDQPLCHHAACPGKPGIQCRHDDPILQLKGTNPDGLKQALQFHGSSPMVQNGGQISNLDISSQL